MNNILVVIVCVVLVLIHLVVGLVAHKLDHLDSLRVSQVPLCGRPGLYQYRVLVKTGWRQGAGQHSTTQFWNSDGMHLSSLKFKFRNFNLSTLPHILKGNIVL